MKNGQTHHFDQIMAKLTVSDGFEKEKMDRQIDREVSIIIIIVK